MIKNDNGNVEIEGGKVSEIMLEWTQLTMSISEAITESSGIPMDLSRMVEYGAKILDSEYGERMKDEAVKEISDV